MSGASDGKGSGGKPPAEGMYIALILMQCYCQLQCDCNKAIFIVVSIRSLVMFPQLGLVIVAKKERRRKQLLSKPRSDTWLLSWCPHKQSVRIGIAMSGATTSIPTHQNANANASAMQERGPY